MIRPLVLYHAGCWDGFGAAWAAYRGGLHSIPTDYVPVQYGDQVPDLSGRLGVYVLDFAFLQDGSAEPMRQMARDLLHQGGRLVWLDHHKTAVEAWGDSGESYMGQVTKLDLNKSGAALAWEYFHGEDALMPWIIQYVQDRDLWRHELPDSKAINAYLRTLPFEFSAWDEALHVGPERAAELGRTALRVVEQFVDVQVRQARIVPMYLLGLATVHSDVTIVNTPMWACSEVVGALAEVHGIAAGWTARPDGDIVLMIRSVSGGGLTARDIAEKLGGGGHTHAAGVTLTGTTAHMFLTGLAGLSD